MATTASAPTFVLWANVITSTLLRAGVKLVGPRHAPMYLLTVPGRKSGQPRTTPIVIVEQEGTRYLFAPFGVVDWVRNLRAAGEAILTRGRRAETVRTTELPSGEASLALQALIESGHPLGRSFGVSKGAPREAFDQLAVSHPVFAVQTVAAPDAAAARQD